jgi:WD40 repeat protein/tetratricopeptide (TPR) repeat protein
MRTSQPGTGLPSCPYPGIEPFSYAFRKVFFGRDTEVEQLVQKLVLHRTVLLYAESGVGKSSILNAGLFPRAIKQGFHPERIRVSPIPGQEFVVERIATGDGAFLPSLFGAPTSGKHEVLSAGAFLQRVRTQAAAIPRDSEADRPLLVFDQFEEWVTLVQDAVLGGRGEEARTAQRRIADVILSLVRDRVLPVKVMLSFREDYLASLTPLNEEFPDLTDSYVRLEPLAEDRILDVVCGPFTKCGYTPAIPEDLAKKIRDEFIKLSGGPIRSTELQIVCERLFLDVADGSTWDAAYLKRKGVPGILEGHLERRLTSLPPAELDQAVALLGCLLTADGTRNVVSEPSLFEAVSKEGKWTAESLRKTLRGLENDARLIVQSARRGVTFYEIASEFLVPWIRTRTAERRALRERMERRARARKRAVRIAAGTAVGLAVLGVFTGKLVQERIDGKIALVEQEIRLKTKNEADSARRAHEMKDARAREHAALDSMQRVRTLSALDAVTRNAVRSTASDPQLGLLLALHAAALGNRKMGSAPPAAIEALMPAMAATPRMRLRLAGHRGMLNAVAVSPGGEYIATASDDSSVRVWDAETALTLQLFDDLKGAALDVAFSADGRSVAAVSDDTVRVWDIFNGKRVLTLPIPYATSVAYSPDSSALAVGDVRGAVYVWRLGRDARVDTLPGRCAPIRAIAISPNSARLAAACGARSAVVWDLVGDSKRSPRTLRAHKDKVLGLAFSKSGDTLVTAAAGMPRVMMWNAASGDSLTAVVGHLNAARGVAFSPTGKVFATVGRDRTIRLVDAATGRQVRTISGHAFWVEDVAFFPDGSRIVTASADSTAVVWDVSAPSGAQLRALRGHTTTVRSVAASPDGRLLVSLDASGRASWWDAVTGDSLRAGDSLTTWRSGYGCGLAFVGRTLAMCRDGGVSFWDAASRRVVDSLVERDVEAIAFAHDGSRIALGTRSSGRIVLRRRGARDSSSFPTGLSSIWALAFSPDTRRIVVAGNKADESTLLRLLDLRTGEILASRPVPHWIRTATFSPSGNAIAVGGDAQTVEILDPQSLRMLRRLPHADIVMDVAFSHSGRLLASASRDGTATLWNPDSGTVSAVFTGHENGARSVAFLPGDRRIVVGAEDGVVRVHALDSNELLTVALDLVVRRLSSAECADIKPIECPTATDMVVEGRRLALEGKVAAAEAAFDSAARLGLSLSFDGARASRSLAARAYVTRARFQLDADRLDNARALFTQARELDPSVETRAMVIEAASRRAEARDLSAAGTILRLGAGGRLYQRGSQREANLLNQLGISFLTANRLDDAELAFRIGAAVVQGLGDYDRAAAYNNLAYALAVQKKQLDSARALVTKAIRIGGPLAVYLDTQAWVEYGAGRCVDALDPISAALLAATRDREIADHYVTIQCTCGDKKKAIQVAQSLQGPSPSVTLQSAPACRQ